MPINPIYKADLGQAQDTPVPLVNVNAAGQQGRDLEQFGKTITQLGIHQMDQEQATEHTIRQIQVDKAHSFAKDTAETVANDTLVNGSPDGQDWEQKFLNNYDKQTSKALDQISDPLAKAQAEAKIGEVRAEYHGQILNKSRAQFKDYANVSIDESKNSSATRVSLNPYNYDKELNDYSTLVANSVMLPAKKIEAIQTAKKEFATSAINSFTNAGSFNEAKNQLQTKFSGVFDPTEQQKMLAQIQDKKTKYIETSLKDESNVDRMAQDLQEKIQSQTFTQRLATARSVKIGDPNAKAVQTFEDSLTNDVQNGRLKPDMAELLRKTVSEGPTDDHAATAAGFYDRLGTRKGLGTLKNDVLHSVNNGMLSPDTATDILGFADIIGAKSKAALNDKVQSDPRFTAAMQRIDSMLPSKQWLDMTPSQENVVAGHTVQEWHDKEFQAKRELSQLMASGKYGRDPAKPLEVVLKKYFNTKSSVPAPVGFNEDMGVKLKNPLSPVMALYKQGKITKEAYSKVLHDYNTAKPSELAIKARKDGGNGQ